MVQPAVAFECGWVYCKGDNEITGPWCVGLGDSCDNAKFAGPTSRGWIVGIVMLLAALYLGFAFVVKASESGRDGKQILAKSAGRGS